MSELFDLPPERSMSATRLATRQRRIEQYLIDSESTGTPIVEVRRRQFLIRRFMVAIAAGSLLVGSTAAAYVAFAKAKVPVADETRCYTKATLEGGDRDFYGTTVNQAHNADGGQRAITAIEACAALWRQGVLVADSKNVGGASVDASTTRAVPPLVACTLDSGIAAVLPGDASTCSSLGIPRLAE
jgi:hypothetical protein